MARHPKPNGRDDCAGQIGRESELRGWPRPEVEVVEGDGLRPE